MKRLIQEPQLSMLKEFLEKKLGLHYSVLRENELSQKMNLAAESFGYQNLIEFIKWLLDRDLNRKDMEKLASYLTIGETYFMREIQAFDFLQNEYLKKYIYNMRNEKKLTIWSAGCSSGEEVYSLAALVREMIPNYKTWQIKILGTDINPQALTKARGGIYSEWSLRNNNSWIIEKYLEKAENGKFKISEELRTMVEFSNHNLATDVNPLINANIIFCRNVLIYFAADLIKKVTNRFYDLLSDGGLLVLSPVEVSLNICEKFIKQFYIDRAFFVKDLRSAEQLKDKEQNIVQTERLELPDLEDAQELATDSPEQGDLLKRVLFLYEEGLYLRVENLILQISSDLEKLPLEYQELLARTYANQGKLIEAETLLEKLVESEACEIKTIYLLANVYMERKENRKAKAILERIVKKQSNFIIGFYKLGYICNRLGEKTYSDHYYKRAYNLVSRLSLDRVIPETDGLTASDLLMMLPQEIINIEGKNE